jgi:hypothetical protein
MVGLPKAPTKEKGRMALHLVSVHPASVSGRLSNLAGSEKALRCRGSYPQPSEIVKSIL